MNVKAIRLLEYIREHPGLDWVSSAVRHFEGPNSTPYYVLTAQYHDLSFADLQALADLFDTRNINLSTEHFPEHRYSSWTADPAYSITNITIRDVVVHPPKD